ncbi:MAG: hypothetical protein ACW99G_20120 [Candidatus Thorarchaeota archaeon]
MCLAYCHNCSESGVKHGDGTTYRDFDSKEEPVEREIEFEVPVGLIFNPEDWPTSAHFWRMEKRLSKDQCYDASIAYDPHSDRMYLPMYDIVNRLGKPFKDSVLVGYQLRRLGTRGAKYLTAVRDSNSKPWTRFNPDHSSYLYLVEDLASAIHLSEALDVGVLVNYGVKVNLEALYANTDCSEKVVWLDNDGDKIIEQAEAIKRTWQLITGRPTVVWHGEEEPKEITGEEIEFIHSEVLQHGS